LEFNDNFQRKMDVLDLIISILIEHEKKLDEIVNKFDGIVKEFNFLDNNLQTTKVKKN